MYNFVFFATKEPYYRIVYNDIMRKDNVRYIDDVLIDKNCIIKLLYKVLMSYRLNLILNVPFKKKINFVYSFEPFLDDNPICFIFFYGRLAWTENGLLAFLRKKYPGCKIVCYFQDLISARKNIDISQVKEKFDAVLSYDHCEAQKYDILYYPTPYSYFPVVPLEDFTTEVYFVGKIKDRYNTLIKIYNDLVLHKVKCDFFITDVLPNNRVIAPGLHYIEPMSYIENLRRVQSCKVILEIMQENASGFTLRTWEAIVYKKKLLSNNASLTKTSFYNDSYISIYDGERINYSFFRADTPLVYPNENFISPLNLLNFIEENI